MTLSGLVAIAMMFVSPLWVQRGDGQAPVDVVSIKARTLPRVGELVRIRTPGVEILGGHPKPAINGQLKTGHFE